MPRIIGVDIPNNKRLEIALTYILGVGRTTSLKICDELKLDRGMKARDLTEEQVASIVQWLSHEGHLVVTGTKVAYTASGDA